MSHDKPDAVDVSEQVPGQPELDLGVVSTGSPEVDVALAPLENLAERPIGEHAEVYQHVFESLATTMSPAAGTQAGPGSSPGPGPGPEPGPEPSAEAEA